MIIRPIQITNVCNSFAHARLRCMIWCATAMLAAISMCVSAAERSSAKLSLLPPTIALSSPEARQTLVAQWHLGEQFGDG
jgi:hypothetical protein